MRKAFDPKNGPLTDLNQTEAERDTQPPIRRGNRLLQKSALASHGQVLLATHLLSIVDARRPS
jgi:hypothetical protein